MKDTQGINTTKTQLILRGLSVWGHPNLRTWEPEYTDNFAEVISADIGHRRRAGNDTFSIRVATPAGLARLESHEGIIAMRPLLVVDKFDYDDVWNWFESIIARCDADDWDTCVVQLQHFLDWEYDSYVER